MVRDAEGGLHVRKLLSTPDDPSRAITDGVTALAGSRDVDTVVHGTTVATNALLERKGGRVAFVTTAGFEDLLVLRRQNRPDLYALEVQLDPPLVPRNRCFGVAERMAYDGSVLERLTDDAIEALLDALDDATFDSVAICLLHAYANDDHERRVAAAIRGRFPDAHVSASSELAREFREYERASTTVVNAFVGPVMSRYIELLGRRLPDVHVEILQSSGGRVSIDEARRAPVHTVLSGPAGGVVGSIAAAREIGIDRIISFDMGGTSTDVSLCDGTPTLAYQAEIEGFPIRVPVLDIYTVGAGGGSIAYPDRGGALRVGPQSAGAAPGPACYGRGGGRPTVTDAHLVLGRLRADRFLGGEMTLDEDASRGVVRKLADELDLDVEQTARGILDVADAAMVRAIKVISVRRGHDPRDFTLVSFGGAGGLHACRLADALGIRRVMIPHSPGLLSAYGMLHADAERLFSASVLAELDDDVLADARGDLARRAAASSAAELHFGVDLRYAGQSFELHLDAHSDDAEHLRRRFHTRHEEAYGYRDDTRRVELVAARLRVVEPAPDLGPPAASSQKVAPSDLVAPVGFAGGTEPTRIVDRDQLLDGTEYEGPMVVTEYSGTTIVEPGWMLCVRGPHLLLERRDA